MLEAWDFYTMHRLTQLRLSEWSAWVCRVICDSSDNRFHCVDFEIIAATRHMCMMCITSVTTVLRSSGLLLAVERIAAVPLPAMACAHCCFVHGARDFRTSLQVFDI